MNDIQKAIKLLSKHEYRSTSNVVGEYVEKLVATATNGKQAKHCQEGYDVLSENLGRVEVKSRNWYAKSLLCTLPKRKLDALDNFILVIIKDGEVNEARLFSKELLLSIISNSGKVYVYKKHHHEAQDITEDITSLIRNN